ncbi:hypothetical protein L1D29_10945 [Shewanella insulae]|uniref:hypothetical protein n=1 Tax=Shewanella insulae TaxID=2681496 RepID=UPI001EFD5D0D|nr:hypothetical protein [Shewanella insulae]MCG9713327.1 hypothetical protein [Shewanella insulae]
MPTEVTPAVIGAAAVIIASIIGLIVAVTTAVIAKEQKVSEFRQTWIEGLRNDISELVSISYSLLTEISKIKTINQANVNLDKIKAQAHLDIVKINGDVARLTTLIKLKLENKATHDALVNELWKLTNLLNKAHVEPAQSFEQLNIVQETAHSIFKSEWELVKRGEKRYIMFVTVGEFCGATFIIAFYVLFALVKFPEYFPHMFS